MYSQGFLENSGDDRGVNLEYITEPTEILATLTKSKDFGTSVGINATALGTGFIVTAVDDIQLDEQGDINILLKAYDMTGHFLEVTRIKLAHIKGVIEFTSSFENPFVKKFEQSQMNLEGNDVSNVA
jgi:hypothetical protein